MIGRTYGVLDEPGIVMYQGIGWYRDIIIAPVDNIVICRGVFL